MLKSLEIKDYALIENILVEFERGLNIITGETGAGKSIIIGSLGLILGDRASSEVIRKGSNKAIVEGIFDVANNDKVKFFFNKHEIDFCDEMIVRREVSQKGNNRCFLNDSPASLQMIRELGNLLVDLHGQHEHQTLLRTETHIEMYDDLVVPEKLLNHFYTEKRKLHSMISEFKQLKKRERLLKEKREIYEFQAKEIDEVSPEIDEDKTLENELNILENSERLISLTSSAYSALYEEEFNVNDLLGDVHNKLIEVGQIDNNIKSEIDEIESAIATINDMADFLRSYRDGIEIDEESLEEKRDRISSINHLKKKYGGSLSSVIEYREKIENELSLVMNFDENISKLNKNIEEQRRLLGELSWKLSELRAEGRVKVENEIIEMLSLLGIGDSKVEIRVTQNSDITNGQEYVIYQNNQYELFERGIDQIEFYISTNLGEDPKPLVKVASGGEVSRIMLALKSILAKNDKLPLLIFDEIDTGISGRIGAKVGNVMKNLAKMHQIIAITHLPQIASKADHHYSVKKHIEKERVKSSIIKLDENGRLNELAKLISGEEITEAALVGASELLKAN